MKKVIATISALLICVTALAGCGDPVQEDLKNYINNQLPAVLTLTNTVTTKYTDMTKVENITDATIATTMKDVVIPAQEQLLAAAKAIVPTTEEVVALHGKLVASVTEQLEAFKLIMEAAQKSDEAILGTATTKLESSQTKMKEYSDAVEVMKKDHNLVNK